MQITFNRMNEKTEQYTVTVTHMLQFEVHFFIICEHKGA